MADRTGIDPLTNWLGLRWDSFDTVRLGGYERRAPAPESAETG